MLLQLLPLPVPTFSPSLLKAEGDWLCPCAAALALSLISNSNMAVVWEWLSLTRKKMMNTLRRVIAMSSIYLWGPNWWMRKPRFLGLEKRFLAYEELLPRCRNRIAVAGVLGSIDDSVVCINSAI
jgi:hypothetical protein